MCRGGVHRAGGRMSAPGKSEPLKVALAYIAKGWRPLPVYHGTKVSEVEGSLENWHVDAETAAQHFNGKPQNIGVLLGPASGGLVDIDLDDAVALRLADKFLPHTHAVFGRKGNPASHWLYQVSDDTGPVKQFNDQGGTLVEYRAQGGYTVFPGSTHESGEPIEWVANGDPTTIERGQLLKAVSGLAAATLLAKRWTEPQDNLASAAIGVMLRGGAPEEVVEKVVTAICTVMGDTKLKKRLEKIGRFARALENNPKAKVPGWPKLEQATDAKFVTLFKEWIGLDDTDTVGPSDDDLALRFAEEHANDLRHVARWGRWLVYDGRRWAEDETLRVFDMARKLCRDARDELLPTLKPTQQKTLRQRLGAAATIYNVVKLAGNDRRLAISPDQLDADPWLLNTPGGVIDLRTGEIHNHAPSELHTKITAATPGGECPIWQQTLARVIPDEDKRTYLQRLFGYGLTGSSRDHVVPFLYGLGRNGKGTVAHTMRRAMGDYGLEIPAEVLMESHNDRHPTELAVLHGARLVVGSEVDTGRRWNESRLKRLSGGDPISARFMGKDLFEFEPTHTLVLMGNSKPGLRSVDEAIRARIHLVDFSVTIPEAERDTQLPEKLVKEYGGILAWAVAGCTHWQADGLKPPISILSATTEYLDGEDHIRLWLAEHTQPSSSGRVMLSKLLSNYRVWCASAGVSPLGRNTFCDQLAAIDGMRRNARGEKSVVFFGIKLNERLDREMDA
jgi:P4 family phage/plasmid primase-like protien